RRTARPARSDPQRALRPGRGAGPRFRRAPSGRPAGSDPPDVYGLRAAVARLGFELHLGSLGEGRAVADAALMDEEVLAAVVGGDEAVALLVAEPLHGACCHVLGAPSGGVWARAHYSARPSSVRR